MKYRNYFKFGNKKSLGIAAFVLLGVTVLSILFWKKPIYRPYVFHLMSCSEVGVGVPLWENPMTGMVTTQLERRAMIEKRLFDCSWRVYRALISAGKADSKHARLWKRAAQELSKTADTLRNYMNTTASILAREQYSDYYIHEATDGWDSSNAFLDAARRVFTGYPELAAKIDPEAASILGMSVSNGRVVFEPIPASKLSHADEDRSPEPRRRIGLLSNRMKFSPLTPKQISLLDEIGALHTAWAEAVHDNKPQDEIQKIVDLHHVKHRALIMQARNPDEEALFTLPEHSPHDVCRDRTSQELNYLLIQTETHHHAWVDAVKHTDFERAWVAGLLHARSHALLATCNLKLPELMR